MGAFFKVSGTYKETAPYVKVSGNWKFAKEAWTKVSGSWKQFFLSLGTNDSSFNVADNIGGFSDDTEEISLQSDGKIVVGGLFTTHNGVTSNRIARLNTDGTLDTDFTTAIGTGFNNTVNAIAIQPDDKIVAGGSFITYNGVTSNRIARLNADGTLDTAFTTAIGTGFNGNIFGLAIQSDGKIVVGGSFTTHNGVTSNRIARLNADGTRDTAFTTAIGTGFNSTVNAIAIQEDGKIVVVGGFTSHNGVTSNRIARLNTDGTRDTAFTTNIGTGFNGTIFGLAIQSDGKIVVGGSFTTHNGVTSNRIARLNADGTRDTDFTTLIEGGFDNGVQVLALQADGKILALGLFLNHNGVASRCLARLNSNGTRDRAFTTAIGTKLSPLSSPRSVVIEPDKSFVFGTLNVMPTFDGILFGRILRIKNDLTVDSNFFGQNIKGFNTSVNAIAPQSDGKIVAGGTFTTFNGVTSNRIARLNTDGSIDTDFTTAIGSGFNDLISALAIQSDQKIVAGGGFTNVNGATSVYIARLNTDGTRDTAFTTGSGFSNPTNAIAIQSDGKIVVVGGFTSHNGVTSNRIARLNTDGTRDTAFTTNIGTGFNGTIFGLAIQSDGKIVVGGSFTTHNGVTSNRIARLNADGTRDTAFTTAIGTGFSGAVSSIAIQSDGKIVVVGAFTAHNGVTSNRIARLNTDGTRDTDFTTAIGSGFNGSASALALQSDDKIVAGGAFTTFNGVSSSRISLLNTDGTLDTAFTTAIGGGFTDTVNAIAIQSDGKIVAGGVFTVFNNNNRNGIARFGVDLSS